jgi:alkylation response protein AidB-like acyl-CoA dehydrogenase
MRLQVDSDKVLTMHQVASHARTSVGAEGAALLEIATALQPIVIGYQDETERERRIPPPLVDQLRAAGFYRMVVPEKLGGLEVNLATFLRVAELMAEGDGSVGWNLANSAIQQLIALGLPGAGIDEIFAHGPDTIIAGTAVAGGGSGREVDGGYVVTGRWPFGSGCHESTWMLGNFDILDGEQRRRAPDGSFMLRRAFFPTSECSIIDTWDMTGMRGTGSHDWTVTDQFIPQHRTVEVPGRLLFNQWSTWPGALYALPVHALIGLHHSVVATGIARAGIDALTELAGAKVPRGRSGLLRDQPAVQEAVARAEAILGAGQAYRAAVASDIWNTVAAGQETTLEQRARCRLAASFAVDSARQAMDLMYRAGGTTSSRRTHRLAHCWRDLQVVGQAASVAPEWYGLSGKVLLGLEPGPRLV